MGTVANVKQLMKLPNECVRALVDAQVRGECTAVFEQNGMLFSNVIIKKQVYNIRKTKKLEAQIRSLKDLFAEYFHIIGRISPDVMHKVAPLDNIDVLTDTISGNMLLDYDDKEYLLEITDPKKRLNELLKILSHEIELLKIEIDIQNKVKQSIDKNQRDYYLREQIKVINEELGDTLPATVLLQPYCFPPFLL